MQKNRKTFNPNPTNLKPTQKAVKGEKTETRNDCLSEATAVLKYWSLPSGKGKENNQDKRAWKVTRGHKVFVSQGIIPLYWHNGIFAASCKELEEPRIFLCMGNMTLGHRVASMLPNLPHKTSDCDWFSFISFTKFDPFTGKIEENIQKEDIADLDACCHELLKILKQPKRLNRHSHIYYRQFLPRTLPPWEQYE